MRASPPFRRALPMLALLASLLGAQTASFTASTNSVCVGDTVHFTSTSTGPINVIRWQFGDGSFASNCGSYSFQTIDHIYFQPGTYTVTLEVGFEFFIGCPLTSLAQTTITVYPPPSATLVTPSTTVCTGSTIPLEVNISGTPPVNLTWSDGLVEFGIMYTPHFRSVMPTAQGTTTYSITQVTDQSPCVVVGTGSTTITAVSAPTANIAPAQFGSLCTGTPFDINVTLSGAPPLSITWNDGVTESGLPEGTHTRNLSVAAAGPQSFSITAISDGCGIAGSSSGNFNFNSHLTPTAELTGPVNTTLCQGIPFPMTVVLQGTPPWTLTWNDGLVETVTQSPHFRTPTVTALGTWSYALTAVSDPNCSSGLILGNPYIFTIIEAAGAAVSGGGTVCQGDLAQARVDLQGNAPWTLTWNDGLVESGITLNPHFRTVDTQTPGTQSYSVNLVSDVNNCGALISGTGSATVTVLPRPTATLSGPATVCAGSTLLAQVDLTGTAPWSISWNDGLVESGIAVTPHVRSFPSIATGSYGIGLTAVSDANCSGTISGSLNGVAQQLSGTVSGGGSACVGQPVNLQLDLTGTGPWTVLWSDGVQETVNQTPHIRQVVSQTPGQLSYSLTSLSNPACSSAALQGSATAIWFSPTATLSGPSNVAYGNSADITATLSGTPPFQITWSDGAVETTSSGSVTHSFWPTASSFHGITSWSDSSGCPATTPQLWPVNIITHAPVQGHAWTTSPFDLTLRRVDLSNGRTVSSQLLSVPSIPGVPHVHGLARHPVTGVVYTCMWDSVTTFLMTLDLNTGVATEVGPLPMHIRALAFDPSGNLLGIPLNPPTLHAIDPNTAVAAPLSSLASTTGSAGVALAWSSKDSRLHHGGLAPSGATVHETLDPVSGVITALPQHGDPSQGLSALSEVNNHNFLAVDIQNRLRVVHGDSGFHRDLGLLDHSCSGILPDGDAWIDLRGSGDDIQLQIGFTGGLVYPTSRRTITPNEALGFHVGSPYTSLEGQPMGLAVQPYLSISPDPVGPFDLPMAHVDLTSLLVLWDTPALPVGGFLGGAGLFDPALSGLTLRFQAFVISPLCINGLYGTSNVIDVIIL